MDEKKLNNIKEDSDYNYDDLKRKYEEYIPRNKKKSILIQNTKVKFNSFHDFNSINSTIKNESKINSEQNRKTEIKKSFEKNITLFNSDENNFDINTKFKLVKNRKIPSFDKSIKSYSNINEIINCFNQNSIIKMEFIKKRIMNLLNNYNILIENFAK